jgi:Ca2+-binding RTX toxin-like protein
VKIGISEQKVVFRSRLVMSNNNFFNQIFVFGDSLSDPGNVFTVTIAANEIIPGIVDISPPVPPYDKQGRITNDGDVADAIWIDTVTTRFGFEQLTPSAKLATYSPLFPPIHPVPPFGPYLPIFRPGTYAPVLPILTGGLLNLELDLEINTFLKGATQTENINFAYGGATSGQTNVSDERAPGVLAQVDTYLGDLAFTGAEANRDALYVVWGGSNDFDPIAVGTPVDPSIPVDNAEIAIHQLHDVGARKFLVLDLPNLGVRPLLNALTDAKLVKAEYTTITDEYNEQLEERLDDLQQSLGDTTTIIPVNVGALFSFVRDNLTTFGFTNIDDSFLDLSDPPQDNPDHYIFWDGEHPTRAAHAILGEFVVQTIANSTDEALDLTGTDALDILVGGAGHDHISGHGGNDLAVGGFGNDHLSGNSGADLLNGGPGADDLYGGSDNDAVYGGVGNDSLWGDEDHDLLVGNSGGDHLYGGSGGDILEGGRGSDRMRGGPDADTYVFGRDLLDGKVDKDIIWGFQSQDALDVDAYLSAGGTLEANKVWSNLLKVSFIGPNGGNKDIALIYGNSSALDDLSDKIGTLLIA